MKSNEMNQFHGYFFFFFPFSESKILIFMENIKKKIREIDLFDFVSFFGLECFKISGPLCIYFTN